MVDAIVAVLHKNSRPTPPTLFLGSPCFMSDKTTSLLSQSIHLKGQLKLAGGVRIDGELEGDLVSEGIVHVGEQADIVGDITAVSVVSSGRIRGNIHAKKEVLLYAPGSLVGNVQAGGFYIDEGVRFEGICTLL